MTISKKYDIKFSALLSWPIYSSYLEDVKTRNATWDQKYLGLWPIMWDMTNIPAYSFSDAVFQRFTYSQYYEENCFKGSVSVQLNGWIQEGELWPGRVSDSNYNRREGYLQKQHEFQEGDLVEMYGKLDVSPFLNVYDKGYWARTAAWKTGKQGVLQPTFEPSDRRFNGRETNISASIASDHGGNERAVWVSKRAAYIRRGFRPNMDLERFDIAWRMWNFKSISCLSQCYKISDLPETHRTQSRYSDIIHSTVFNATIQLIVAIFITFDVRKIFNIVTTLLHLPHQVIMQSLAAFKSRTQWISQQLFTRPQN